MAQAEREIRGMRSLKHPMICEFIDIVKDKDNFPCIIMEKCNQSLKNIIESNQEFLEENYIIRIFTMIIIPLYYIHNKNMVHRDLKPDNIL